MSMIVMQSLIWRLISQVVKRPNLLRGFTSSMTQSTTYRLMKLFFPSIEIRMWRYWQVLSVSLTRLTKTSLIHRKSYSNGTLEWDILGSNISNGWSVQSVWNCKENPRQWSTVKVTSALPVSLERVVVDPIKENTTKKNPMKEKYLKKDNLVPV